MPTAKEYRRYARENKKHHFLFTGMAIWKSKEEYDVDPRPMKPEEKQPVRIASAPVSHRTDAIRYLTGQCEHE